MNFVLLSGNLGKDPKAGYTSKGVPFASFNLATSEEYQKDGQIMRRTTWHHVRCFGKLAERVGNNLQKGRGVTVRGSLATNEWEDDSGRQRRSYVKANFISY